MEANRNAEILAVLYNSAIVSIEGGDISGAAEKLQQALELGGNNPLYLEALGLCLYTRGSFRHAKACWTKSAALEGASASATRYLKHMASEEFISCIKAFNDCIEAIEKGKYLKALSRLMPSLESIPSVEGYNLAGLLFYKLGMRKSALRLWKKALCIDLSDKSAAYYISNCKEGLMPLILEKILWEVLGIAEKLKLL